MKCQREGCQAETPPASKGHRPPLYCSNSCKSAQWQANASKRAEEMAAQNLAAVERVEALPTTGEVVLFTEGVYRRIRQAQELRLNLERNVLGKGVGW